MHNGQNIKPEIQWSQLRSQWAPGFEAVLQYGIDNGLLAMNEDLERYVILHSISARHVSELLSRMLFRRLAIPWLQDELDRWIDQKNSTTRRANKYKVLPHGIPDLIYDSPEDFGVADFKVCAILAVVAPVWCPDDTSDTREPRAHRRDARQILSFRSSDLSSRAWRI